MRNFPWRKKVEIEEEIKKLEALRGSEFHKLWAEKIRANIRNDMTMLLQVDFSDDRNILNIAKRLKSKYDDLCIMPNEIFDLKQEMETVEAQEERLIAENQRRGIRRAEGSV